MHTAWEQGMKPAIEKPANEDRGWIRNQGYFTSRRTDPRGGWKTLHRSDGVMFIRGDMVSSPLDGSLIEGRVAEARPPAPGYACDLCGKTIHHGELHVSGPDLHICLRPTCVYQPVLRYYPVL